MIFIYRIIAAISLGLSLATLSGCETTTTGGAVGANRSQLMLVSSGQLDQMAAQSYAKLQSDATRKGALNQDHAMLQRVRTIASRLEPQTRVFRADAPGWKWEVNVIASNELSAFCMPGGKSMVYSGLINQLHLTDDVIAIVTGWSRSTERSKRARPHMPEKFVSRWKAHWTAHRSSRGNPRENARLKSFRNCAYGIPNTITAC